MITFDFEVSTPSNSESEQYHLASVDEMTLRYDLLLGDITIKVDSADISARWGWVPILDFAASLRRVRAELSQRDVADSVFEFTESDAKLYFSRSGTTALISASFTPAKGLVSFTEFCSAVDVLIRRVVSLVSLQYPALLRNEAFRRLFEQ